MFESIDDNYADRYRQQNVATSLTDQPIKFRQFQLTVVVL